MNKTIPIIIIFCFFYLSNLAQSVDLIQGDTIIPPLYSQHNLLRIDTIHLHLHLNGNVSGSSYNIAFVLDNSGIVHGSKPLLPSNAIQISHSRWLSATALSNTIDTFLVIQVPATADTLKNDEIARLSIANQPAEYVQIRISNALAKPTGGIIILSQLINDVDIVPFEDDIDTPKKDSIKVKVKFVGDYNSNNNTVHFYLSDTSALTNKVQLLNPNIYIDSTTWRKDSLDTCIYISSTPIIDTGTFKSTSFNLKIKEDTLNSIPIWMTYKNKTTWYRKSNFFIGSFIKSISGTTAQNELLDIFLKVNLSSKKHLDSGKALLFGFFGADAGISSDTVGKKGLPLNEAMVSINFSPHFLSGGIINSSTNRIGFIGVGLKVFYTNAYIGAHIGVTELSGVLKHSYLLAGFYHSPWLPKTTDKTIADTVKAPAHYFRNNIYFEAAFNAFGDHAPKALQFIRLKFGLMLPVKSKDFVTPSKDDFIYRLAVEVPIGGPLKF